MIEENQPLTPSNTEESGQEVEKKLTRQQAINAHCKSCIYDPHAQNGSWVKQVEDCMITRCELHDYRPLTSATKAKLQEERFNAMSLEEQAAFTEKSKEAGDRLAKTRLIAKTPENITFI